MNLLKRSKQINLLNKVIHYEKLNKYRPNFQPQGDKRD